VVLGKGVVKLGLEQRGVFPRLVQLFLQGLSADDRVAISLEELRLLLGFFSKVLHATNLNRHWCSPLPDNSGYSQRTLTHRSIPCHDSMLSDTTFGSISSPSSNSSPPRLEVLDSSIGTDRRGAASSTIISRMTTSVLFPSCRSTCASTPGSGAEVVVSSAIGSVVVASIVVVSLATASGIVDSEFPSA
jgi:hypothetical protein